MGKVTRIAYSKNLNPGKLAELRTNAQRLGTIRSEVWKRYGSVAGVGVQQRDLRDAWVKDGGCPLDPIGVNSHVWKETLRDTMDDIGAYRAAAKVEVKSAIRRHTQTEDERKRLYTSLKYDRWTSDPYLRRQMRKHFKHGRTSVDYQIVLSASAYKAFFYNGRAWIEVASLTPRKRIAIPLTTTVLPTGTLRLLLRGGKVEVHYQVDANKECSTRPSGSATVGIDKGYTETFTDSDGQRHGEGLGDLLSGESDFLKQKYARRNKLKAIAAKKAHKRSKINQNNLGRKKLLRRKSLHTQRVRDKIYKATHSVVDKAAKIAAEDLTFAPRRPPAQVEASSIKDKKKYSRNQSRRLSGWVKGTMAEALSAVAQRRGSSLHLVNAAYTSQTDSTTGLLLGQRIGDRFHRENGDVLDADTNAAKNILARMYDTEIQMYTPYREVKAILQNRTLQNQRLGLLNLDTSCNDANFYPSLSTVSELPILCNV